MCIIKPRRIIKLFLNNQTIFTMNKKARVIAFYLPQYHPIPENDEWWGKGFTEWTNVAQARPRFRGHYQPHIPADLGFYDLRLPETRIAQADMAKEYGIYGFCYYHYWFNGKRLMERPVNEILSTGEPDFPFMLCWANENWARNWDGGFRNVLIEQDYSFEDDANHIKYLCEKVFCDKRYITINERPVFAIYKPYLFPNIQRTIEIWREIATKYGFNLYLTFMLTGDKSHKYFLDQGFDAAIDFQPHKSAVLSQEDKRITDNFFYRFCQHILKMNNNPCNLSFNYERYLEHACKTMKKDYKEFPCVSPGWDNSPRRVNTSFFMLKGNTPDLFGKWIKYVFKNFIPYSEEENLIFINAWNEWAEGNHLEPDLKWGKGFLEKVKEVSTQ